ncbi:hypothetical protein ETAA8_26490 [Anatilimnocola aggregata]|uniref:Uncharacterized protein n=2 Tax=Anatilimnocola aggregata TaxID=2528021 RepID=A0A517YBG8_9BACT|nr:hypothetical protein ETAA8_26490 [Anatilimnocola aggregata]
MACPKCGGMVLVKPPETPQPASASDTGETRSDLSGSIRPLPPASANFPINTPINTSAFDDVDALLGNVPARSMVPVPTARTPAAGPPAKAAARPAPPMGTQPTVIRSPDAKQNPDSQAKTISQNDIPVANPPTTTVRNQSPVAIKPSEHNQQKAAAATAAAVLATASAPAVAAAPIKPAQPTLPINATPAGYDPTVLPQDEPVATATGTGTLAGSPWQYWAIVSASGALGVILAIGVVAMTLSWFSSNAAQPIANLPTNPALTNPSTANPGSTNTIPEQPPTAATPVAPAPSNPPVAPETPNPAANVPPTAPVETAPVTPAPLPNITPVPVPVPKPPEIDPLGLTAPQPPEKPLAPGDDPLSKFDNILGGGNENPLPSPAAPEVKPVLPPLEVEPEPAAPTDNLPKPEPLHVDAAARLSDPLPAIEIAGTPLADFLQVMQDLSTVPITLRPDGLSMVKLIPYSPETPITWKGEGTTIGDALRDALQPMGLEARLEAGQLVIDVASPQLTTMRLAVKDLTGSDENRAAELSSLFTSLIAPDSWSEDEGQPTLITGKDEFQVRQHRLVLAECVLLAEKLRVARGGRPASKFDPKLFELTTRTERAQAALATPITLNYSQPTSLLRVADRLGKAAKVRILIDWQSLASAGWNPLGEVTLTVEKQPLATVLDDLTRRMQLAWRVVDGRTLQIVSLQSLAAQSELEVYPVRDLLSEKTGGDDLVARLRTALGNQHFREAGGHGELRFDATGNCLLASLSQPQQRQLAAQLAQLRGAAPAK